MSFSRYAYSLMISFCSSVNALGILNFKWTRWSPRDPNASRVRKPRPDKVRIEWELGGNKTKFFKQPFEVL